MARYNEEVMEIARIIKDKNRLKAQIAGGVDTIQIGKRNTDSFRITDFNLKYDTLISVIPVSEESYNKINSPLLLNVRREGIPTWMK